MDKRTKDWLPSARPKVYEMAAGVTVPYLNANLARCGLAEGTTYGQWYKVEFLEKAYNPYTAAYKAWENPVERTQGMIVNLAMVEKVFIAAYRKLRNIMRSNPTLTDADLTEMGFPVRPGKARTPAPVAQDPPGFSIDPLTSHRLSIAYYPFSGVRRRGKPHGQHGVEIRWSFSETPVVEADTLTYSLFDVSSPAILSFNGNDQGRSLYVALRWENMRGEKGPWSHISRTTVP